MWGKEQENSFLKVKEQIARTPVVAYFNKEARTGIACWCQSSSVRDCACKGEKWRMSRCVLCQSHPEPSWTPSAKLNWRLLLKCGHANDSVCVCMDWLSIFFSLAGRLCYGGFYVLTEQMRFFRLVSNWEVMTRIFSVSFVSGRQDFLWPLLKHKALYCG